MHVLFTKKHKSRIAREPALQCYVFWCSCISALSAASLMPSADGIDRSELEILFERSIIHAQLNDLSSERIKFRNEELLKFFLRGLPADSIVITGKIVQSSGSAAGILIEMIPAYNTAPPIPFSVPLAYL